MRKTSLLVPFALCWAAPFGAAQSTALQEDFQSCVVPPVGWFEVNNGVSPGWEDDVCEFAFHDDFDAPNDNHLQSPVLDLTSFTTVWLHAVERQQFATFRDVNEIWVSTDGWVTWDVVWSASATEDGTYAIHEDLSAYAGLPAVQFAFVYQGEFANRWWIDQVTIDDQPFVQPPHWPNLPTQFVSADAFLETFDTLGGTVPPYMAVNQVDSALRSYQSAGWCNIGQLGICQDPRSGQYCLELGLNPSASSYPEVANALILGLNGAGVTNFVLDYQAFDYGEESQPDDGIFLSEDGVNWTPLVTDWRTLIGQEDVWTPLTADLSSTSVDVSGDFYLAIAQADDYPFGGLDGVAIDDLSIGGTPPLLYDVQNLVAGSMATFSVTGADPTSLVVIGYSLRGPGPTTTPYGIASLSNPIEQLGRFRPNAQGEVIVQSPIPPTGGGAMVWTQALEITIQDVGIWSNSLALVVQ